MLELWSVAQSVYYGLSLGSVLLLAAAGNSVWRLIDILSSRRDLRTDLAEIGHVLRGDLYGFVRAGAMIVGVGLAGFGHLSGKSRLYLSRRAHAT